MKNLIEVEKSASNPWITTDSQVFSLFSKIKIPLNVKNDCWEWVGSKIPDGYGYFCKSHKNEYVHRVMYDLMVGPIGPNQMVLHSCDNPSCCNPYHLRVGSQKENLIEMASKGRGGHGGPGKLDKKDVEKIRLDYARGKVTTYELAAQYDCTRGHISNISNIINGRRWA